MKRIWREFLFWGFVSLFAILAPTILLYTAGYRYQLGSDRFIRTGVLSLSASPRSVDIFLNGEATNKNTPTVLKQLLPDTYEVSLQRNGYHAWFGEVDILEGESYFLNDIMLFLQSTPELITQEAIQEIAIHPTEERIAYSINAGAITQIWLQTPSTGETTFVHEQALDADLMITWSAEGGFLLIESEQNYLYTKDVQQIEIADEGNWEFDSMKDYLIFQNIDGIVNELNLETRNITDIEPVDFLSPFGETTIQLIDNGQNVEIRNVQDDSHELIAVLPSGRYEILEEDDPYLLLSRNGYELLLLDISSDQVKQLEALGTIWDWNSKTKELVYSDGHEVTSFETSNGHREFITRQSDTITSLHWLPEGDHILLSTQNAISVFEQFAQAKQRFSLRLSEHNQIATTWLSDDGDDVYYLVEEPNIRLMRLQLRK